MKFRPLSESERACWRDHGYVLIRGALSPSEHAALTCWTQTLEAWPEQPGAWMKYFEPRAAGAERRLCRVENFFPYHDELRALFCAGALETWLRELMGEAPRVFKEKINFKLPGGQGFTAHQDAPAFAQFDQRYHVTAMLGVDATTVDNGCLELVHGRAPDQLLEQAPDGTLAPAVIDALDWQPLETSAGDLVMFDSYLPHRSGPNRSSGPRRAYYVTYNRASDGDVREAYFARKRQAFPPECERDPDAPPSPEAAQFNLGNPII